MAYPLNPRLDDRRLKRTPAFAFRRASASFRGLPSFLIAGAMKCGTSSLFAYLLQDAKVHPPLRKEVHYFGLGVSQGKTPAWYRAHFPRCSSLRAGGITGEATPDYLFDPDSLGRIRALIPEARIIVLLRDPVERAISHYFHELRMGREYLPIEQAMQVEEERFATAKGTDAALETRLHASYKARGVYADQLIALFRIFPRDQVLVLGSGTLFRTPHTALKMTGDFLGLEISETGHAFPVKNRGENRRMVPEGLHAQLDRYFAPHNARLFDLLHEKPDW